MKPVVDHEKPTVIPQEKGVEAYELASQWKLMWWRFRKHHLAIIAAPILILLLLITAFCGFLGPHLPKDRFVDYKNAPPQQIHFVDADGNFSLRPFVYDLELEVDAGSYLRTYREVTSQKHELSLFVEGKPYQFWGLFETNIHFLGLEDPSAPFFILGTDELGRDLFTRILYGTRISISFAFAGILLTLVFGLLLGGISGYFGGITDTIIQRIIDLLLCLPTIPLWMALSASLPKDWTPTQIYFGMVLIFSMVGWTGLARVVRGKILSLREEDFTMAARLAGASHLRIITKHLLPSFASYIIINITISIPALILGETALSFLGLGLQAPAVSWGVLLEDAQHLESIAFHPWLLWPAAFVVVTVLVFNFLGDGLRDAADPYK
ncbi:ABC transporter permease [Aureibacillus halotolerans]|uniref:Peptide/nickel transport system permease protein n=1 Tax=Aureibacillus halotolerans TaxID=1508390 RepID=A0A4R6U850_9BACI|nr:ABC transporter permease [Aureibacillus halotolerans]TDQ40775.1 peptide/nickel transport system permease protein [Aureibacillus halotolerans]